MSIRTRRSSGSSEAATGAVSTIRSDAYGRISAVAAAAAVIGPVRRRVQDARPHRPGHDDRSEDPTRMPLVSHGEDRLDDDHERDHPSDEHDTQDHAPTP
jgi:hypothetical protein